MAAMNKTQRERIIHILNRKGEDAVDKLRRLHKVPELPKATSLTCAQLIAAVNDGTFVMTAPGMKFDRWNGNEQFVHRDSVKAEAKEKETEKKVSQLRKKVKSEIDKIEDRLIFEDVTGVDDIIASFSKTLLTILTNGSK